MLDLLSGDLLNHICSFILECPIYVTNKRIYANIQKYICNIDTEMQCGSVPHRVTCHKYHTMSTIQTNHRYPNSHTCMYKCICIKYRYPVMWGVYRRMYISRKKGWVKYKINLGEVEDLSYGMIKVALRGRKKYAKLYYTETNTGLYTHKYITEKFLMFFRMELQHIYFNSMYNLVTLPIITLNTLGTTFKYFRNLKTIHFERTDHKCRILINGKIERVYINYTGCPVYIYYTPYASTKFITDLNPNIHMKCYK